MRFYQFGKIEVGFNQILQIYLENPISSNLFNLILNPEQLRFSTPFETTVLASFDGLLIVRDIKEYYTYSIVLITTLLT